MRPSGWTLVRGVIMTDEVTSEKLQEVMEALLRRIDRTIEEIRALRKARQAALPQRSNDASE